MEYTTEVYDAIVELARLKGSKKRNGTKIHYAEKHLEHLKAESYVKNERKILSQKRSTRKRSSSQPSIASSRNRAYVLSCESQDFIQAMLALERLQRG